ncbi:MAG: efflux RND transporter periplasmic adaptor subunit [Pseudomonadota bacterium]
MNRKLKVIFANLAIVATFVVLIMGLGMLRPKPERQEPVSLAPVVFVDEVEYEPVSLDVFAQGEVRPKQQIDLASQVGGKIVRVADNFAEGGVIKTGDVLIEIEDADYRLAVTRAKAQVASAKQALEIERAESELAKADFEELSALTGQSKPSDLTLRRPQLARAEADYQSALANLEEAKLALSRTKVVAPFNGRVRTIAANLGQFISPSARLGQIFSTDIAEVRLPLTDEDLARLNLPLAFSSDRDGPIVTLSTVVAGRARQWVGRIARIDAAIDTSTRQIAAIVEVNDPYGTAADKGFPLAMGLFVDAQITGPILEKATIVPRIAVRNRNTAFTVSPNNEAMAQQVTVVAATAQGYVITDGLEPGQKVIVSRLIGEAGAPVRPLPANAPASSRSPTPTTGNVTAAAQAATGVN